MTTPWEKAWAGRLDRLTLHSTVLEGNPLGDPADRPLWVYVPPGYDADIDRRYPAVYVPQGYGADIRTWDNAHAFTPSYPEAVDDLFSAPGGPPPCLVVFVDAWTAYGGSQFVDSAGTGRYHSYLCDEVVAFVDQHYRTLPAAAHRGIQGKSSGGFGAMITPMLRPDLFGGLATHAGDSLYETLYIPEFAAAVRDLRPYDGSILRWWDDFRSRPAFTKAADMRLLLILGCTAAFSPAEDGTPILPFDPRTGRLREEVWDRWLEWDPVRMVPSRAAALRGLKAVWIDGGRSDEWYLDLGAEAFRDALAAIGVTDVAFELFEGKHGGIAWRYPLALAYLAQKLSPPA